MIIQPLNQNVDATGPIRSEKVLGCRFVSVLLMTFTLCASGCGPDAPSQAKESKEAIAAKILPPPTVPESEWKNTHPGTQYIGSARCRDCHADIHQNFQLTRHSKAFADAKNQSEPNAVVRHPLSGYEYSTKCLDDGRLLQTESVLLGDDRKESTREVLIDFVVGSGRFGKSYLAELDGFLIQSPLTWFEDRQEWGLSPGYNSPQQFSFRRTVSARCLYCHAGLNEIQDHNEYFVEVKEHFVSCERCHGPGELHEQKHLSAVASDPLPSQRAADDTIVNPKRLDRKRQEAICQQCHLQTDAQVIVRGQKFDSFRPGMELTGFRQDYHFGSIQDQMTVVGHVEQLHQSACYTQTDHLTCITCHQPHSGDSAAESLTMHRQNCLQCHQTESCLAPMPERQLNSDHCTVCHMPSAPTEVPHVAFTHHRIGIHGRPADKASETETRTAKGEPEELMQSVLGDENLGLADRLRCRGLAAMAAYLKETDAANRETLKYAQENLQRAWDLGAQDAAVAAALAKIGFEVAWPEKVQKWAKIAIELDDNPSEERSSALIMLSELRFNQGNYSEAYDGFVELTQIRRDARTWFFRGICEQNLERTEDALKSLQKSVEINPRNQAAHVALAVLFRAEGNAQKAEYHQTWADRLVSK